MHHFHLCGVFFCTHVCSMLFDFLQKKLNKISLVIFVFDVSIVSTNRSIKCILQNELTRKPLFIFSKPFHFFCFVTWSIAAGKVPQSVTDEMCDARMLPKELKLVTQKTQKMALKKSGKLVLFINAQPLPLRPQKKRDLW